MKSNALNRLIFCLLIFFLPANAAASFSYHYDASLPPDHSSLQDIFSTGVFTGTSWASADGELIISTAYQSGIWFGNATWYGAVSWSIGNSNEGNSVSLRAKLLPESTDWQFYLYDGTYWAFFNFFPNEIRYHHSDGYSSYNIDTSVFHTYSFSLMDGVVRYFIDGVEIFSGNAFATIHDKGLVIGDGSGSDIGGSGSFVIDDVIIHTPLNLSDTDGDGVYNDGDYSVTAGDNPCIGGQTENCDDNCPNTYNPDQRDVDGNGVGDLCESTIVLELYQEIPTSGAFDFEEFTINEEHYLAVANYYNGSSFNIASVIYKWNGKYSG